ncbi:hypothetical protein O4H52_11650 [Sphingomonadaceae bacterium G21617-S1]|nr:hypothetical protein [Sphingomonadaceae bacterium G21617-S1]
MNKNLFASLKQRALTQGVRLRDPIGFAEASKLANLSADENMLTLIECLKFFDGFDEENFDPASEIRLWSCDEIALSFDKSNRLVKFSDFSLMSEVYGFNIGKPSTVFEIHSGTSVAKSVEEFYTKIVVGDLDF